MKKYTNKILLIVALSIFAIFTIFAIATTSKPEKIVGNGNIITKTISISNFSKIEIETQIDVIYSQEENNGTLEFTTDENLFDQYDFYVKEDKLIIKLKGKNKWIRRLNSTTSTIKVSSLELTDIEIAGESKFNFCTPFVSESLEIELAGSGKVVAHKFPFTVENCKVEIAGSGEVVLVGKIQNADLEIAGSGNIKALQCEIAYLKVEIAGSGDVEAHVTEALNIEIAGSGSVKYSGNPKTIEQDVAGSGKITKIND